MVACNTHQFWRAMTDPGFVRIDLHTGAIGSTLYKTDAPPEKVPGFMERIIDEIDDALKLTEPNSNFWTRWLAARSAKSLMRKLTSPHALPGPSGSELI